MLGLILLYWIGKYFYKLAEEYNKSKWGFAILGIASYYIGTYVFAILIAVIVEVLSPGYLEGFNERVLSLILLPFGLLSCYLLYYFLKKNWKNHIKEMVPNIDDIGVK